MKNRDRITETILEDIEELELEDKLEILANVFIKLGISDMRMPDRHVSEKNILEIVMNDIKENGETIANAIVRQGLLILTWLNKEKE
tara:strand:- start:23 stop:283 length:261 start_codon:yes stop_codon:yes gene_type:complete